jgi:transcriptional regulator with XRE-family HTH domain
MTSSGPGMDVAVLGRMLRSARKRCELTVGELAERAKVSAGLISQLERGRGNPSFLTLSRLAEALDVSLGHFLQGDGAPREMVVRRDHRKKLVLPVDDPVDDLVYELLTPDLAGRLEVLRTQVPAGWSNEEQPFRHAGEECVHVLEGRLEVTVGSDFFELDEGDSITYEPSVPHWWRNASSAPALIIGVVTPPSF